MVGKPDYVKKHFGPLKDKTLKNALIHAMGRDFPRIGGERIRALCADMVLEVMENHLRPRDRFCHGQVLWLAVDVNDPPRWRQRIADTHLVPVVLEVSTGEDVQARLDRESKHQRLQRKAVRLCQQAYGQGGLLSNCDIGELLSTDDSLVAHLLEKYQRETGKVVPRRATVHDVGTGMTHKRIIIEKRYLAGLTTEQIARQTYHSVEAVDRYLGQFDRVRHCRQQKLTVAQTAYTLNCSPGLVEEYLAIDRELEASMSKRPGKVARASSRGQGNAHD